MSIYLDLLLFIFSFIRIYVITYNSEQMKCSLSHSELGVRRLLDFVEFNFYEVLYN